MLAPKDKLYWVPGGGPEHERLLLESGLPPPALPAGLTEGGPAVSVELTITDDLPRMAEAGRLVCVLEDSGGSSFRMIRTYQPALSATKHCDRMTRRLRCIVPAAFVLAAAEVHWHD